LRLIAEKVVITTASLGTSFFFQLIRRCLKRCSQYLQLRASPFRAERSVV
jgi:hypothetical protein